MNSRPSTAFLTLRTHYRRFVAILAINAAIVVALSYSFGETMRIGISATPERVSAVVDQTQLDLKLPPPRLDSVGIYLAGPKLSESPGWPTDPAWYPYESLPILHWILRPQAETALSSLMIKTVGAGESRDLFAAGAVWTNAGDWFPTTANELTSSAPGVAYFETQGETAYQVTANLKRARQSAAVLLLDSDGSGLGL